MLDAPRLRLWIGLFFILSGCNGNGRDSTDRPKITVSPSPAFVEIGEQKQLTADATDLGSPFKDSPLSWRSLDTSIADVDRNGIVTGINIGVTGIVVSLGEESVVTTIGVVSPELGSSNASISGTALYEDKPFNESGFLSQPPEQKPIRNAVVSAIAIDGFITLGSASTDSAGRFSFTNLANDRRRAGIYIQIQTKTDPGPGHPSQVEIRNNPDDNALLAIASEGINDHLTPDRPALQTIAGADSGIGGAFNILDVFEQANELIQASSCPPANTPCIPPLLTAYWEPGSSDGTYYDDVLDAIFILGGGTLDGDTDEYDDSVIAHEYGHFVMKHFAQDDSPGGPHEIRDNRQDIRLAWSEGWGNFFSSAVRNSPLYVDTTLNGSFSVNLEDYTSPNFQPSPQRPTLSDQTIYTTNEVSIAGALWDIFDAGAETHDQVAMGFDPIWQTILKMGPATSLAKTIESFWILFSDPASSFVGQKDAVQMILQERKMDLFPDTAEGGVEQKLALGTGQFHTLYLNAPNPIDDEDRIPFDVKEGGTYTLETFNLKNGADTFLSITDASGVLINNLQNDNRNNRTYQNCNINPLTARSSCPLNDQITLSSSLMTFTWSAGDATLFAHVKRSPDAPPSAGFLGSYELKLTQH